MMSIRPKFRFCLTFNNFFNTYSIGLKRAYSDEKVEESSSKKSHAKYNNAFPVWAFQENALIGYCSLLFLQPFLKLPTGAFRGDVCV